MPKVKDVARMCLLASGLSFGRYRINHRGRCIRALEIKRPISQRALTVSRHGALDRTTAALTKDLARTVVIEVVAVKIHARR